MRTLRIYSFNNFHSSYTAAFIIFFMLHTSTPLVLIYLYNQKLVFLTAFSQFPLLQPPPMITTNLVSFSVDRLGWRAQKHACAHMGTRCWQGCQDRPAGKGQSFQQTMRQNWTSTCNRTQMDSSFSHTKSSAKWIKYLKVQSKTAKLVEENTKEASWEWSRHWFIGYVPKAQPATPKALDKLDYLKLKNFCASTDSQQSERAAHGMGESIYKWPVWKGDWYPEYVRSLTTQQQ